MSAQNRPNQVVKGEKCEQQRKIPEKWDIPSLDLRVHGPHNQTNQTNLDNLNIKEEEYHEALKFSEHGK